MDPVPDNNTQTHTGQKYPGNRAMIAFIILLASFPPFSTDLYLPALPGLADYFHVSADITNLTLILFFVFFGL